MEGYDLDKSVLHNETQHSHGGVPSRERTSPLTAPAFYERMYRSKFSLEQCLSTFSLRDAALSPKLARKDLIGSIRCNTSAPRIGGRAGNM